MKYKHNAKFLRNILVAACISSAAFAVDEELDETLIPDYRAGDVIDADVANQVNAELVRAIKTLELKMANIQASTKSLPTNVGEQCRWNDSGIETGIVWRTECEKDSETYGGGINERYNCAPILPESAVREGVLTLDADGTGWYEFTRTFSMQNIAREPGTSSIGPGVGMDHYHGRFSFVGRDTVSGDKLNTVTYSTQVTWAESSSTGAVSINVPKTKELPAYTLSYRPMGDGVYAGAVHTTGMDGERHDPGYHGMRAIHSTAGVVSCD